jgi:ferrochelatase
VTPNSKKAILLINIGSPQTLTVKAVRAYLRRFLMDPYVIQIPFLFRFVLFYIVICTIRAPKTFLKYQGIWRAEGSPFHFFTENFRAALEKTLGARVLNVMMYSEPGFKTAFAVLKTEGLTEIIAVPMYPQYADSSYRTSVESFKKYFAKSKLNASVKIVEPFYREEFFIEAVHRNIITQYPDLKPYDQLVFSYHGLPQSHVDRAPADQDYQKQCLATTELLVKKLGIGKNHVTCFQSRVGVTKWIKPYLDQTCETLAIGGAKKLLVISPSFVVDGLETLQEITDLETELKKRYNISIDLVKGLNAEPHWVQGFAGFISKC